MHEGVYFLLTMGVGLKYEILGSLRIGDGQGTFATLTARKMEILLAALLIRAEEVVSIDQVCRHFSQISFAGNNAAPHARLTQLSNVAFPVLRCERLLIGSLEDGNVVASVQADVDGRGQRVDARERCESRGCDVCCAGRRRACGNSAFAEELQR